MPDPSDEELLAVLNRAATAIRTALDGLGDWGLAGTHPGQYRHDLVADHAALTVLQGAGLAVVSEESGDHRESGGHARGELVAVVDPVDGSTNASRGIPWWNTSICIVDAEGPRVALVVDQVGGARYSAVRGGGAHCDGRPLSPSGCTALRRALIGLNGYPARHLGWKQYRALGATALDLCAVAAGILDAYLDCTGSGLAPWDYLGGVLICKEAGAAVADLRDDELSVWGWKDRRVPVAAATPELLREVVAAAR